MSGSSTSNQYKGSAHLRLRLLKDRLTRWVVGAGGTAVIIAILLIFIYLLYVVMPLLESPEMQREASYALSDGDKAVYLSMEEQAEIGAVIDRKGRIRFLSTVDGHEISQVQLPVPETAEVVSFSAARPDSGIVALGFSNGQAVVLKLNYRVSFPNDKRLITPEVQYPLGEAPLDVNVDGASLDKLAIQQDESFTLVAWSQGGMLSVMRASPEESLMEEEAGWTFERSSGYTDLDDIVSLLIDPSQRNLYLVSRDGTLAWFDISDLSQARLQEQINVAAKNTDVSAARFLAGGNSIMVASDDGEISQWFQVRDKEGVSHLRQIRSFDNGVKTRVLASEYSRKGFLVGGVDGSIAAFQSTTPPPESA